MLEIIKDNEIKELFKKRAKIIKNIRNFFDKQGFLEMDTPIMTKSPGMEPYLTPFKTKLYGEGEDMFFNTSPEYSMKKLLCSGFEKIFEFSHSFRNCEEKNGLHTPEFLLLEWYRANSNYKEIENDVEDLIIYLAETFYKSAEIEYLGKKIKLKKPFKRFKVKDLFLQYAQVDLDKCREFEAMKNIIKSKGYQINENFTWDDCYYLIFLNEIEPKLKEMGALFIEDYPLPQAALAKKISKDSFYAERFEFYINGIEIANAFSELTDGKEQEDRLKEEQKMKKKLRKDIYPIDKEFVYALNLGMPESGGIALGIDRLIMILLNQPDLQKFSPYYLLN